MQFNMICSKAYMKNIVHFAYLIGMIIGCIISGPMSDMLATQVSLN